MLRVAVYNADGETVGETELREDIFGIEPNIAVMHQALLRQLANARLGTHKAKTRGEVSGTTQKVWRQKGTGRARHGSRKVNLWRGGGVAHGPRPRSYEQQMPRKMRRLALRSALSVKAADGQIVCLDRLEIDEPKTRTMAEVLERLGLDTSVLILLPERNENVEKSVRNIPDVRTLRAGYLNVRDLLDYDFLLMPLGALREIERILG
ncbi:MAG: 50S ribosomal protein L4 [Anaerolineae bacterium]|jgi:large subunit ribosomal protein L4|nr:50S ribosomal protein L4 [Anaerolineae bacterium]MDH7473486.1 50S ribosomal protein L4 [Anaerolineae bacterium]